MMNSDKAVNSERAVPDDEHEVVTCVFPAAAVVITKQGQTLGHPPETAARSSPWTWEISGP